MQPTDINVIMEILKETTQEQPPCLSHHPLDKITFDDRDNSNYLSTTELEIKKELNDQLDKLNEEIDNALPNNLEVKKLIEALEETNNNINSLDMNATFREGMLNGFRLAQFFLLGNYQTGSLIQSTKDKK